MNRNKTIDYQETNLETIVFGGGCFWCTEAIFKNVSGVVNVVTGYAGGNTPNPTYETVSTGKTEHAEVIEIEFDPNILPFRHLLEIFFMAHDPTALNRQGADVGSQYRSVILYNSLEQKTAAEDYIKTLEKKPEYKQGIVTQILPLDKFWPAENEHQNYFAKHRTAPYCQAVIEPKLEKLSKNRLSE